MRHIIQGAGPGRPKGSPAGRTRALLVLDELLGEADNRDTLRASMQAAFDKNPLKFFRQVVIPLLPKTSLAITEERQGMRWTSLLELFPSTDAPAMPPLVNH